MQAAFDPSADDAGESGGGGAPAPSPAADDGRPSSRSRTFSMVQDDTLYEQLGLTRQATPDDIKRAYRRLALRCHPDKRPDEPDAEERFKQINYANGVLSNPKKRRLYDAHGQMGLKMIDVLGEDNLDAFLMLNSVWAKLAFFACCFVTGCFCCCCCLCCCNCCCGKCKPKPPTDDDYNDIFGYTGDAAGQGPSGSEPVVTMQPDANGDQTSQQAAADSAHRPAVIAMPPPPPTEKWPERRPAHERSPLNDAAAAAAGVTRSTPSPPPPPYGSIEHSTPSV